MKIQLTESQTEDALDHIGELVTQLQKEHRQLRARWKDDRDGYPTRSMGNAGSPTNQLDDDGTPIPQHPDPVSTIVISRDEAGDPIGQAIANMVDKIANARRHLEGAGSDAARARPPIKLPDPDSIWCKSCERADHREPRDEGELCRWCADWKRNHGQLPWPELVDMHHRGKRITPARIAEVQRARAQTRNTKRRKGKR